MFAVRLTFQQEHGFANSDHGLVLDPDLDLDADADVDRGRPDVFHVEDFKSINDIG